MDSNLFERLRLSIEHNSRDYRPYLELGEAYLNENPQLTYLCMENAMFLCEGEEEKRQISLILSGLKAAGVYVRPVSFVILSYNTKEFTKTCIESIRKTVPESAVRLVVVDNASTDGSVQYLKEQQDITLICNDENKGFPAGCNQGIEASEPDTDIFLLNNDTILLPNSLFWLRMGLYSSEKYGTAGCVTNCAGHDQILEGTGSLDPLEKSDFNKLYEIGLKQNGLIKNPYEEKLCLVGFALLIKREMIDKVGMLDEQFSPGNFEDDDYCLKVLSAGYKNILVHNSFIIHFGSVSFSKNPHLYGNLISVNLEKICRKWGLEISCDHKQKLIEQIDEPEDSVFSVLELGCAMGAAAAKLRYLYPNCKIYGVDNRKEAIEFAKMFADARIYDPQTSKWPFANEMFDYIIVGDYLQGIDGCNELSEIINSSIKHDGSVIM